MSLGPKVQLISTAQTKAKSAPIRDEEREIADKLEAKDQAKLERIITAERKGAWWQGFAVASVIVGAAMLITGVGITLANTTALFEPISKTVFQTDVARHMYDKSAGQ